MKSLKQILLLTLCLLLAIPNLWAEEKKPGVKSFFAAEVNFGASTRKETRSSYAYYYVLPEVEAKLSYKTVVYGFNFAGGIEFSHYLKVGLGTGYSFYKQDDNSFGYVSRSNTFPYHPHYLTPKSLITHRIPIYLYLRSDFFDKKVSPFIDLKVGNNFLITKDIIIIDGDYYLHQTNRIIEELPEKEKNYGKFRLKNGLFVASNFGVAIKINHKNAINTSIGYQSVSRKHDLLDYANGKKYIKTGYTITDHQFLFNIGITF